MSGVLACGRFSGDDVTPAAFSSIASSYAGNNTITTDTQEVTGIKVPIQMRVFWSMSKSVNVYVYVNGVEVASTGASIAYGQFDVDLEDGDEFYVTMLRNAVLSGYLQFINLSASYTQLALTSVSIT